MSYYSQNYIPTPLRKCWAGWQRIIESEWLALEGPQRTSTFQLMLCKGRKVNLEFEGEKRQYVRRTDLWRLQNREYFLFVSCSGGLRGIKPSL